MEKRKIVITSIVAIAVILAIFILDGSGFISTGGFFVLLFFLAPIILIALAIHVALKPAAKEETAATPVQQAAATFRRWLIWAHFGIILLAGIVNAQIAASDGFITGVWYAALAVWVADLLASIVCFVIGRRAFGLVFIRTCLLLMGMLPFFFFFICASQF